MTLRKLIKGYAKKMTAILFTQEECKINDIQEGDVVDIELTLVKRGARRK